MTDPINTLHCLSGKSTSTTVFHTLYNSPLAQISCDLDNTLSQLQVWCVLHIGPTLSHETAKCCSVVSAYLFGIQEEMNSNIRQVTT
jgi:hypothetical protein